MNRTCLVTTILLLVIIAAGFYKFILQGSTIENSDDRITILLDESERNLVLAEMRAFLASIQQISQGLAENDMELIALSARSSGNAAQQGVPGSLAGKLPIGFKKLGRDTHAKFDQLAMDAKDLEDSSHTIEQLSDLMKNCISCHAKYRIDI
ncbi:MAG: cytochrome c [Gammaproteobacteria bacterium]|nr:cytochrome c [Gammaproteobacteria bacterium]MBT8133211.1 cytochrome c [Gammaproteobacteria bacterium]NNJ51542.1 cytochrome c [Gammaproteobacteria bacterium]